MGQLKGLKGTVKEVVDQDTVQIQSTTDDPASSLTVDVPNKSVKLSNYEMGDSVMVIQGDKMGVEGLVIEVTEGCVIIYDRKSKEAVGPTCKHETKLTKKLNSVHQVIAGNRTPSTN
jgi:ribosomal protein L24